MVILKLIAEIFIFTHKIIYNMGLLSDKGSTGARTNQYAPPLTKEECLLLLAILQETTFRGKDIETLFLLINKIKEMAKFYEQ